MNCMDLKELHELYEFYGDCVLFKIRHIYVNYRKTRHVVWRVLTAMYISPVSPPHVPVVPNRGTMSHALWVHTKTESTYFLVCLITEGRRSYNEVIFGFQFSL